MSDVLIKGMEMPKTEKDSFLVIVTPNEIIYHYDEDEFKRYKAVELLPHGDLIDRSKLPTTPITDYKLEGHIVVEIEDIENAPTILEASEVKV